MKLKPSTMETCHRSRDRELTLLLAERTLFLLFGVGPAAAVSERTRTAWQEGCEERQLAVLDKCNLGPSAAPAWTEQAVPLTDGSD